MGITGRSTMVAVVLLSFSATALFAQQFNGTWMVRGDNASVTVTMQQDAQGNVRGTWVGNGTMQIEGMVEEGIAVGAIYDEQGGVYFEAQLQGTELLLTLIEPGSDNQPDYSKTRDLVLTSQAGAAVTAPSPGRGEANPLAGGAVNQRAGAQADPLVGVFVGEGVRLALEPGPQGYGGSLTVQGQAYPVTAVGSGRQVRGSFVAGGQQYEFQAQLDGTQLTLSSGGSTYRLSKQGGAANPIAGAARAQPAAADAQSLIGQWSCQTAEGPVQLRFVSQSELVYNGESSPYQIAGDVIRVPGDWGPVEYRYRLQGESLSFTGPDGSTSRCRRQEAGQAAAGAALGGGQYNALLRGQYCSYSSSPDGGFSTTRRMFFDGVGRVTHVMLGEYSVPEGGGYGQGAGDPGSYSVTGYQKGAEVRIKFDSSNQTNVFYVYVGDANGIYELWFRDQVYSPQLCP